MKRRSLLTMVPVSALLSLRGEGAPIPAPMVTAAGFAISVQAYSFKPFTVWEAVEKTAEVGAGAIEFFPGQKLGGPHGDRKMGPDLAPEVLGSLREHCAKNQVAPVNFGVCGIPNDESKARAVFEMAKALGLYGLTTESTESMDVLEKLAREYDVKICFHNHPKGTKLGDPLKTWELVKDRDEHIGFCCDVGHLATSGYDPLEIVRRIAPRIRSFHLKDRGSVTQQSQDIPFGTGVIDLPGILGEARRQGFAGHVSIEYDPVDATLPKIAQCVGYLRAYAKLRA
ncbi:MAG: sugar phosphate isomerase/epimerase [Luteolibacter sp.]